MCTYTTSSVPRVAELKVYSGLYFTYLFHENIKGESMKATGIVRRIDELGRVVIPKEIRSTLRLKSGDPLEIFTDRDELMLKKYSPIASLGQFSCGTAKSLSDLSGYLAVICDTDEIICASGSGKKEVAGKIISAKLDEILKNRKSYVANLADGGDVVPVVEDENISATAQVIVPIVSGGDCLGAVALLSYEQGAKMEQGACKLAQLSATILANQFE